MDPGQYMKNPLYVSLEEFNNGMTKRKENKLRKEFRAQSDHLVKDVGKEDNYHPVLKVVHCSNEEARKNRIIRKTLETIRSF